MKFINTFCISFFVFVAGVLAWDINKTDPQCKGVAVPGILDTRSGVFLGGNVRSQCVKKYCKCGVVASGSIFPPKVSSFSCIDEHGCRYKGLNGFGLPMQRIASPGCAAERITEAGC